MNCEELQQLLPELVDGSLPPEVQVEAEMALLDCPQCRHELETVRQVRTLLLAIQAEQANLQVPAGFEARLLARISAEHTSLDLFDLSSRALVQWLIEMTNLLGLLLDPGAYSRPA
jgi:anti-sigma factor RsiW